MAFGKYRFPLKTHVVSGSVLAPSQNGTEQQEANNPKRNLVSAIIRLISTDHCLSVYDIAVSNITNWE